MGFDSEWKTMRMILQHSYTKHPLGCIYYSAKVEQHCFSPFPFL